MNTSHFDKAHDSSPKIEGVTSSTFSYPTSFNFTSPKSIDVYVKNGLSNTTKGSSSKNNNNNTNREFEASSSTRKLSTTLVATEASPYGNVSGDLQQRKYVEVLRQPGVFEVRSDYHHVISNETKAILNNNKIQLGPGPKSSKRKRETGESIL